MPEPSASSASRSVFQNFGARLKSAAASFDRPEAARVCDELSRELDRNLESIPAADARACLGPLRGNRWFDLIEQVARRMIANGQGAPLIRRLLAQSLIDQERVDAAIPILEELDLESTGIAGRDQDNAEARGLLGRAYKQKYVTEAQTDDLGRSLLRYYEVWRAGPSRNLWHGINAAALLARARHDGVPFPGFETPERIAKWVLGFVEKAQNAEPWDLATAAEACIALDDYDGAVRWIIRYTASADVDAFALASTRRQFVEVWRLNPDSRMGASLVPLLEAELLKRSGGELVLHPATVRSPDAAARAALHKILGDTSYVPVAWWDRGRERCLGVARIETELDPDRGIGTGFLMRGSDLRESLGDGQVLVTNAHVVSENPNDRAVVGGLEPGQAFVSFKSHQAETGGRMRARKTLWSSPYTELDATLLVLDGSPVPYEPFPVASALPSPGAGRVYVIGHPKGGGLSFSINDNRVLDHDDRVLHYRAPTEGGSSGSPVFDAEWRLVALHHSGRSDMRRLKGQAGTYAANEGIRIQAIRKALEQAAI